MGTDPYKTPESELYTENINTRMFANLKNFGMERSGKQAFGFYITYIIIGLLLGMFSGGIAGAFNENNPQQAGLIAGQIVAVIYSNVLYFVIARKKGLLLKAKGIILFFVTLLLSILLGGMGGLIPVAYMSTVKNEFT